MSWFEFHGLDFFLGCANVEFMVWISYQDVLMGMDFLSGLRIVDFRVWISYLDVNF